MTAPRCSTIGHSRVPATHAVTYKILASYDDTVTEPVCAECADSYTRRPALGATATPLRGTS